MYDIRHVAHLYLGALHCRPVWQCSHCGSEYNCMVIEQRLIEAVQQLSLSDVLQDVECARCHGVSDTHTHIHTYTVRLIALHLTIA